MIVLETPRLLLRRPMLNDLEALVALYADPKVIKFLPGGSSISPGMLREALKTDAMAFEQGGFGLLTLIDHERGEFIGQCGMRTVVIESESTPVLSCMLQRGSWKQGLATEALQAVREHALAALGHEIITGLVHPKQKAGARLAAKLGLERQREVEVEGLRMQQWLSTPLVDA